MYMRPVFQKTNPTEISWTEEIYGGHLNCFKRKLLDLLIQLLLLELKKKKKKKENIPENNQIS